MKRMMIIVEVRGQQEDRYIQAIRCDLWQESEESNQGHKSSINSVPTFLKQWVCDFFWKGREMLLKKKHSPAFQFQINH